MAPKLKKAAPTQSRQYTAIHMVRYRSTSMKHNGQRTAGIHAKPRRVHPQRAASSQKRNITARATTVRAKTAGRENTRLNIGGLLSL